METRALAFFTASSRSFAVRQETPDLAVLAASDDPPVIKGGLRNSSAFSVIITKSAIHASEALIPPHTPLIIAIWGATPDMEAQALAISP